MSTPWIVITALAVVSFAIKAAGPVVLGGRDLPERFTGVIVLMSPALLTALVATAALADGDQWRVGAVTVGVVVAAVAAWRGASAITAVVIAVAVTALLRALS